MAQPAERHRLSRDEFIAWESTQTEKHDYWRGEVFAMVGARRIHVVIALNIAARLKNHLRAAVFEDA
ncbi:MAG: Uma2 family endonuclease [Zoogloeaceae bacterium]|nr:Uma2 family endonuclease [Zoogloeaceae bacterium]